MTNMAALTVIRIFWCGFHKNHPNLELLFSFLPGKKIIDDSDVNKLRDSFFEISRRTIFLIHGFTGKIQLLLILTLIKLNIYY